MAIIEAQAIDKHNASPLGIPFCGSGTTCYVARKLGRHFIGIEINPKYVEMARKRLSVFPARLDNFFEELEVKCESI